jgi:hypothetical protein
MEGFQRLRRGPWARRNGAFSRLAVLAAFALACLALVMPAAAGIGARATLAMGALPACRYDDILTAPRRYVDWRTTLVDPILRVPSTYVPPDLVSTAKAGLVGGGLVRALAIDDLRAMSDAARDAGAPIAVQSAYRSYGQQQVTFQYWIDVLGYEEALRVSARPGHSEHQLGLAIDFRSEPGGAPWNGGDWAATPAGAWMHAHAWQYGWILSYPRNTLSTVCYSYEPWHYRYVGRELAEKIHASGLTTRAYLWAKFTTTVVGAPELPTPAPSVRPTPAATHSPTPEPTVDVEASASPSEAAAAESPQPTAPRPAETTKPTSPEPAVFTDPEFTMVLVVVGIGLVVVIGGGLLLSARRRRPR